MKTYTIQFQQQKPGSTKRIPVATTGIEVDYGSVVRALAIRLGSPESKHFWEVPLKEGYMPQVIDRGNRQLVYDCHPLPLRDRRDRYFLVRPNNNRNGNGNMLVRINTEAGEAAGPSGAINPQTGGMYRVGYGQRTNRDGANSVDCLVVVCPGTEFVLTAGGTGTSLYQKYTVACAKDGEIKISPFVNGQKVQATEPTLTAKPTVAPVNVDAQAQLSELDAELAELGKDKDRVAKFYAKYHQRPVLA